MRDNVNVSSSYAVSDTIKYDDEEKRHNKNKICEKDKKNLM